MLEKNMEDETLVDLQKQHSDKFKFLIIIFSVIGIILFLVLLISAYLYFKSPEKTIGLGANIESALLSSDGNLVYLKLLGASDKNITKIKFIFTDKESREYYYETSEGIKEIEVPFKRSFWQWLFGKPAFSGEYDYQINSGDAGLNDFENINEVGVLFEYQTETGKIIETPKLDTERTTNRTTTTGGGSSSGGTGDGGTTTPQPCNPEPKETTCGSWICGVKKNNCNEDVDCGNCSINENCIDGICIPNFCLGITECSNYTDETNCTTDLCDAGICKWNSTLGVCYNYVGNVYYVSQLESCSDSWEGNSTHPWCNLSRAYTWYSGVGPKVQEGDTVLFRNGSYGVYYDTSKVARTNWVTYQAATGYNPVLTNIYIDNYPSVYDSYLKFDGWTVGPYTTTSHGVITLRDAKYLQFLNLNIIGNGAKYTAYGIYNLGTISDVTIDHCVFSGVNTGRFDGFCSPIYMINVNNLVVTNNDIKQFQQYGVLVGGVGIHDITISNNDIHLSGADADIGIGSGSDILIENNKVHDLYLYEPVLTETTTETIWSLDGKTMTNEDATWGVDSPIYTWINWVEIWITSGTNVKTGDNEIRVAAITSPTEIVFSKSIKLDPNGATPSNVVYKLIDKQHGDLLQVYRDTVTSNITIRNNEFYDCYGQSWWMTPSNAREPNGRGGSNYLIENNLFWDTYTSGQEEYDRNTQISYIEGVTFRNNTVIGRLSLEECGKVVFVGNVIGYIYTTNTHPSTNDFDYNIYNRGAISNYSSGVHDTFLNPGYSWTKWNASAFTNIFADYYGGNFSPIMNNLACNGSINPVGVAVGALPCVCTNNSQCEEVFGEGATCDIPTGKCIGGTVGSLSPFTQLLNFLKGLLTTKTGNAITGNVVNEVNKTGKGNSKVPYIILFLLIGIILIIAVIILKIKKKKSGKRLKTKKEKEINFLGIRIPEDL